MSIQSKRKFIMSTGALAGFTIVKSNVLDKKLGHIAPSDKLNIAGIGLGGMGRRTRFKYPTKVSGSSSLGNLYLEFSVIDGDPRFNRKFETLKALESAKQWIRHIYNNSFTLPPMPSI